MHKNVIVKITLMLLLQQISQCHVIFIAKTALKNEEIRLNQLKLALTWNRSDIAQEEIFREDVLWPTGKLMFTWNMLGITQKKI